MGRDSRCTIPDCEFDSKLTLLDAATLVMQHPGAKKRLVDLIWTSQFNFEVWSDKPYPS